MLKIHVYVPKYQGRNDFDSLKLFDFYYAYRQYLNASNNYQADVKITFSDVDSHRPGCINIGWFYMPDQDIVPSADKFDLVFFDNGHHHLELCTETIFKNLCQHDNCYLVSGAYLDPSHKFFKKIIYFPIVMYTRDYMIRPFYPQFYDLHNRVYDPKKQIVLINGTNRGNRQYLMDLLNNIKNDNLTIRSTLGGSDHLQSSFFESDLDTQFREFVQSRRRSNKITHVPYYEESPVVGIDQRYGLVPPGYFFIDEYYEYHSVIFPETSWLNNELMITEKMFKCCISGAIPWPVAGARINEFYNKLGYQTACNLLPEMLQYDQEQDHVKRYKQTAEAVAWSLSHPEIWNSDLAQDIRENNRKQFFSNTLDAECVTQLETILNECRH